MLKRIITCVVVLLLLTGHSIVLNAQCTATLSCTKQFKLNEVVICHKGICGEGSEFTISRSASLFPQLVGVCHNASKSFLTLTPYLVGL